MAPQPFKLYYRAIRKLGAGTIALPGAVRVVLVTNTSNFATMTLSLLGSLTNEVAAGNGYATGGQGLTGEVWTAAGAQSAGQVKFDANDPTWTATGGAINNIMACALNMSGSSSGARHMLARASLSSAAFNIAISNTVTLTFNTAGIFTAANG